MKRQNLFCRLFFSTCLSAVMLFMISCSEWQDPSPISPNQQTRKPSLTEPKNNQGEVTPVLRKSRKNSLAKGTFHDKAVVHLQDLIDELQYIVDLNPGTAVADKIEDVVAKAQTAMIELKKSPPDYPAALGNLDGAKGDLQAAIDSRLINSKQGSQFKNEIVSITTRTSRNQKD